MQTFIISIKKLNFPETKFQNILSVVAKIKDERIKTSYLSYGSTGYLSIPKGTLSETYQVPIAQQTVHIESREYKNLKALGYEEVHRVDDYATLYRLNTSSAFFNA